MEHDMHDGMAFRSGFVTVVGRPNVGKSTLMNALVGTSIAIASSRPETTRKAIRGIVSRPHSQMVLVDTPGIHRPRTLLGQRLNDVVDESLADSDVVAFLLPADQMIGPGDKRILTRLRSEFWNSRGEGQGSWRIPVIAIITKIDKLDRQSLVDKLIEVDQFGDFSDIVLVSALEDDNVDQVHAVLVDRLPEGPKMYPDDQLSEESKEDTIAELIRGAFLETLDDELPHSLAVVVDDIVLPLALRPTHDLLGRPLGQGDEPENSDDSDDDDFGEESSQTPIDDKAHVYVSIYVERDSQKPIILGKKACNLVKVRKRLRTPINRLVGCKAKLELHVKVAKGWQSDPKKLERLGF